MTCELYTLFFVQLASAQMSQSKLCLGSFALCFCGEQLMMHMSMRQHETCSWDCTIENIFVASLRSDGAFGVALVFKPEGQYCICALSHGGASPSASPNNHRRTGTLICHGRVKDVFCNIAWSCQKGPCWCNDGDVVLPCFCVCDLFSLARSLLHIITQGYKVHVFLFKGVLFR